MAPRKRKQPERKRAARRGAGLALRGLAVVGRGLVLTGRLISRHPVSAGGSAIFAVVFSFVAANAMWYQNGTHPSPLLRTRVPLVSPEVAERLAAAKGEPVEQRDVTTFVIEREGDAKAGDAATPDPTNGTRRFRRRTYQKQMRTVARSRRWLRTSRRNWQGSASTKERRTAEAVRRPRRRSSASKSRPAVRRPVRRVPICFGHCATPAPPRRPLRRPPTGPIPTRRLFRPRRIRLPLPSAAPRRATRSTLARRFPCRAKW